MKRYAALDIGSQTIRLLIADCDAETLYPLERKREIVQLGSDMQSNSLLRPDKIEQALACLQRFCEYARAKKVDGILAVATSCVRRAQNSRDFITRVQQTCGIVPEVITGQQEAELSRIGVLAVMPGVNTPMVIVDIGGGSTELSFIASGVLEKSCSLELGVIAATEQFMHTNPPKKSEIRAMKAWIHSRLSPGLIQHMLPRLCVPAMIIATAGTATTLAAMDLELRDYVPARINAHVLSGKAINTLLQKMIALPLERRAELTGLEQGRAEVIIAGTVILQHVLQYYDCDFCTVSDSGLLEGIVLQHASLEKIVEKA